MRQNPQKRRKLFSTNPNSSKVSYHNVSLSTHHPSSHFPSTRIDEQSFNYQYLQFMSEHPLHQDLKQKLKYLYILFDEVCQRGGLINTVSSRKFDQVSKEVKRRIPALSQYEDALIFEHYKLYIFQFEIVMKLNTRVSKQLLGKYDMCKIYEAKTLNDSRIKQILQEDIALIPDFCQHYHINAQKGTIKGLYKIYENTTLEPIQVLVQKQFTIINEGIFKSQASRTQNCTLSEIYYTIDKNIKNSNSELKLQSDQIITCDKFDPIDDNLQQSIFGTIKGQILGYKSNQDLLSYLDEDIPSITVPVFKILTKGSWMGPTQEPAGATRIDINLGDAQVMWYCVPQEDIQKLRKILITDYDFDFFLMQGKWWVNVDWLIMNGIKVKNIIQKKNQAIILGAGSLYWYISSGISVHSGWNILPISISQHRASIKRITYDKQIQLSKYPLPIKSLYLRYLNHETPRRIPQYQNNTSNIYLLLRNSLKQWLSDEQKYLNQLIIKCNVGSQRVQYYKLYDSQAFCIQCKQQILLYFIKHYSNMVNGISCLQCFKNGLLKHSKQKFRMENQLQNQKVNKKAQILYHRYDQFHLHQLINSFNKHRIQINNNLYNESDLLYQPEYEYLCFGEYIGNMSQKCVKNYKPQFSQMDFQDQNEDKNSYTVIKDQNQFQEQINKAEQQSTDPISLMRIKFLNNIFTQFDSQDLPQKKIKNNIQQDNLQKISMGVQTDIQNLLQQRKLSHCVSHECEGIPSKSQYMTKQQIYHRNAIDQEQEGTKATQLAYKRSISPKQLLNNNIKQQQSIDNSLQDKIDMNNLVNQLLQQSIIQPKTSLKQQQQSYYDRKYKKVKKSKKYHNDKQKYQRNNQLEQSIDNSLSQVMSAKQSITHGLQKSWLRKFQDNRTQQKNKHKQYKKNRQHKQRSRQIQKKFPNAQSFNFDLNY